MDNEYSTSHQNLLSYSGIILDLYNLSSPYYISANERSDELFVTQLLEVSNYHTWVRFMKYALQIKNKLRFVDESLKKPTNLINPLMEH